MIFFKKTTFRRYTLFLEISALALTSVILFAALWFALSEMTAKYLELRRNDAAKIHLFLESHFDDARRTLTTFAAMPEVERTPTALQLFSEFSDIYQLDAEQRVTRIYKSSPGSKIFPGYTFSGGKLADYLNSSDGQNKFSEIMRGQEDDAPSIYYVIQPGGQRYLGRLNLDYVRKFLSEFSRFSGTPLMLVAKDGFVMLSGDPELHIPSFDFKQWEEVPMAGRTLSAGNRRWIPIVTGGNEAIGARIVVLTPTELLVTQRNTLLAFLGIFLCGMFFLSFIKNRRMNRLVLQPLAAFAEKMRGRGQGTSSLDKDSTSRFEELAAIQSRIVEAMEQIEQSEARFRGIFEQSPLGIVLFDARTGHLLECNEHLALMTGRSREELLALGWQEVSHPEDLTRQTELMARLHNGEINGFEVEKRYLRPDGTTVWAHLTVTAVSMGAERSTFHLGMIEDISARVRYEQELRQARDSAESANRAKSAFLANMSHEIRTPMNAILGFAQVLGRDLELNAAQRSSLSVIQRSGEHLLALINDVLDMAKIEAGGMTVTVAPFDLPAVIHEMETFFRQRALDRGLTLTVGSDALPRLVNGDEMRLRQVLINLMGNAVKFTTAGSVSLQVETVAGNAISFSVRDTGPGIAPDELARIFEPFTQSESGRNIREGTGLGLALSRQFVRLMGGEITAASEPGRGSCFSFSLHLPPTGAAISSDNRATGPIIGLEPGQPVCRILIVDDLPDNREPLRALLDVLNPEPPVLEFGDAANGREAVAVWEAWQPQVIFMDMRMPVMTGEDATRRIRELEAARPEAGRTIIVALTASAFDEHRDSFLACGCDEFARKPFLAEALFEILERRAGLQYIRSEEVSVSAPEVSPVELTARLAACPEEWRAELRKALALGDFGRINVLVEQIGNTDAVLREALAKWAYNYDLESLTQAVIGPTG